jgi:hypothetical protein
MRKQAPGHCGLGCVVGLVGWGVFDFETCRWSGPAATTPPATATDHASRGDVGGRGERGGGLPEWSNRWLKLSPPSPVYSPYSGS